MARGFARASRFIKTRRKRETARSRVRAGDAREITRSRGGRARNRAFARGARALRRGYNALKDTFIVTKHGL